MFEIVKAGGWLMPALILCSVVAVTIIAERLFALRHTRVLPEGMAAKVWQWVEQGELDERHIRVLRESSPLGVLLATGLDHRHRDRDTIKERIEDAGRHVVHDLSRFLNSLGTIAAITPLLGLLGTVVGMMKVFHDITEFGVGDPGALAGGISQALITTAAGLLVAIPSLIAYRYLRGRVDALVIEMEKDATRLIDTLVDKQPRKIRRAVAVGKPAATPAPTPPAADA
ncbi:MAG: MotA/TolQ/ExbB proton channel family protein [Gammaproteobacteria bacterium]